MSTGYTLVICEKPDSARSISNALSGGECSSELVEGTKVFRFVRKGEEFVVCAAQGHVYGVSDPSVERTVYPVFDIEWYPSDLVDESSASATRRISAVSKLAVGASKFVNACDYDVEGETIGYNLLKYACGGKEKSALRAMFSTLTEEDLVKAFDDMKPQAGQELARAGRTRHAVDFIWGVNLSRALSQSALGFGHRYRTVSVGRVQGPTLEFLAERELEIREFVPIPHWKASGTFERDDVRLTAGYAKDKVETRMSAEKIRRECVGEEAVVTALRKSSVQVGPPAPFNIGDLQKEAHRAFGYTPSRTLQIAERLYLSALISYPRTGSQRLPPSINYRSIIHGLGRIQEYSVHAAELLKKEPKPVHGAKTDAAHPAIHPTGEKPKRPLQTSEAAVFDLVARRFLAAFGPSARRELAEATLAVGGHEFRLAGGRTVFPGWMKYYGRYAGYRDVEVPPVSEGDRFRVVGVTLEEKFEQRPPRYNQSSLLEKMEKEGIGTKATRAEIITTLVRRGYVSGDSMEVTALGLSVVETMSRYAPTIVSTELTREIEGKLEAIEWGRGSEVDLLRETVRSIAGPLDQLNLNEDVVGREIDSALTATVAKSFVLGKCPVCKSGDLKIIRSRATKKRFVGCSNYSSGCHTSAPLPQKGTVRTASRPCERCSWPVIYVGGGRRPWRLCVNPNCPGKEKS
ncbi:MAG TPA: DNA topoisomerase I [Nitrososphaerales archaeon]|nr:DNA topoisomerase I [Nitrososphaerales archaeon]